MSAIATLDAPHPKQDVTQRNAGSSPFLRLPLELRIMIYEFAVHVDCPIRPQQIAKGSNKFVWGSNVKELDEGSKYFPFSASSKSLTVTALARTCRMVYHDLEVKPVFYRVNVFEFTDIKRIHPFIAAITPARRSSIRRINISSGDQSDVFPRNRISRKDRLGSRVVPLLLQCHDLRRLNLLLNDFEVRQLIWSSEKYYWHPRYEGDAGISLHLGLLLQWLGEPLNSDEPSLLNIPSLCVTYQRKSRYDLESHLQVIVGTQMDTVELQGNRAERARQLFGTEIAQIEAAMVSRRGLLDDKEKTMLVTDEQLKTSIAAAGLYFPGEERVSQDRTNSDIGAISSRTRNRCNKASLNDSYGIVEREVGKYDAEGLLTTGFRIHDLRTVDSFIECEISEYSIYELESIYRKKLALAAIDGQVMQSLPAPRDITLVTDAFRDNNTRASTWHTYRRRWARFQVRYEAQMNKLAIENGEEPGAERQKTTSTKTSKATTAHGRGKK